MTHPSVAEAAVVGMPHEIKGQCIVAFVTLRQDVQVTKSLIYALIGHVEKEIGKIARPEKIHFVQDLPKTRSGKIMRRVVRKIALGENPEDITTLANPEAVEKIRQALEKEKLRKE